LRCAGQRRRVRSASATVGLEPWPRTNQSAFHRLDPNLAARVGEIAFVLTHTQVSPRTLSLAASPPRLVKGWVVASSYPASSRFASRRPERTAGKMRLPDFCNRPTSRAPFGPFDSRARLLRASRPAPCDAVRATLRSAPFAVGRSHQRTTRVEPRLTASLQLQRSHDRPGCRIRGFDARTPTWKGAQCGPGGCCDRQPLRRRLPAAVFSTASRARDMASDALCRAPSRQGKPWSSGEPDPLLPPPRQRQPLSRTRAPSIDECSLPLACAAAHAARLRKPLARPARPISLARSRSCEASLGARHRAHGFATASRLPPLVRLVTRSGGRPPER